MPTRSTYPPEVRVTLIGLASFVVKVIAARMKALVAFCALIENVSLPLVTEKMPSPGRWTAKIEARSTGTVGWTVAGLVLAVASALPHSDTSPPDQPETPLRRGSYASMSAINDIPPAPNQLFVRTAKPCCPSSPAKREGREDPKAFTVNFVPVLAPAPKDLLLPMIASLQVDASRATRILL